MLMNRIADTVWEIPPTAREGMRVPARVYATEPLIQTMEDGVFEQIANVATLPGIVRRACCMPDGHWGYGFPIGGVAAMDADDGVISPGGIGFDINCGMRLIRTDLTVDQVRPKLDVLLKRLANRVSPGTGGTSDLNLSRRQFLELLEHGAGWCVSNGYGTPDDLEHTEDHGCMREADAAAVSNKAVERGLRQVGTLGSGNHYLEIQVVEKNNILNQHAANVFGVGRPGQIAVMVHCGSRGFGHQVAADFLSVFADAMGPKYGLSAPDKQLACAPFRSPEGQRYFAAMACAVNMAFANRQVILHRIRKTFGEVLGLPPNQLGMRQVYDVTHNTAKLETHRIDGVERLLLVHRKGATRAFPPGADKVPLPYRDLGQPVIIGGSMETGSYLLTGTDTGAETFFTTAHGSGRFMSRSKARKQFRGTELRKSMAQRGITVHAASMAGLAEEAGGAYKNVDEVVAAAAKSGLSTPVVRFRPIGNLKG